MPLIIGRAPLRLPLAGGMTDIPDFLDQDVGRTISIAISLHVYAQVKPNPAGSSSLHLNRTTLRARSLRSIPNDLLMSVLEVLDADLATTDLYLMSDMPGSSGLGGSGAATVALVAALSRALGRDEGPSSILAAAAEAEVRLLKNGGYHDTAISVLGGLQEIIFDARGIVDHNPLSDLSGRTLLRDARMIQLPTSESTAASIRDLRSRLPQVRPILREMASIAAELGEALRSGPPTRKHLDLIRQNQALKARVLGGAYETVSSELSEQHDTGSTVAIIPGGKLGSTMWLISVGGDGGEERPPSSHESPLVQPAGGAGVIQID